MGITDLESIHNSVHGYCGGQMSQVSTAAFDPFFWLHHATMDRILALWQERHPQQWVRSRCVWRPAARVRIH